MAASSVPNSRSNSSLPNAVMEARMLATGVLGGSSCDIGGLLVGRGEQAVAPVQCRTVEAELGSGDSHVGKPVLGVVEAGLDRRLVLGGLEVRADPHRAVLLALGLVRRGGDDIGVLRAVHRTRRDAQHLVHAVVIKQLDEGAEILGRLIGGG